MTRTATLPRTMRELADLARRRTADLPRMGGLSAAYGAGLLGYPMGANVERVPTLRIAYRRGAFDAQPVRPA